MSWQSYINNLMEPDSHGKCYITEAAICGIECKTVWAKTPGMRDISKDEIIKLSGSREDFGMCGPHVAGVKCRMLKDNMEDENSYSINLQTAPDAEGNSFSVCVGKSFKALIYVKGTSDAKIGNLAPKVYEIANYLRKANM